MSDSSRNVHKPSSAKPDEFIGRAADITLLLKQDMYEWAQKQALDSGQVEINERRLESILAQVESMALVQVPVPYDPENSDHDRARQNQFDRCREKRLQHEHALTWSRQRLLEEEQQLAELPNPGTRPSYPLMSMILTVFCFAVSLTPSIQLLFSSARLGVGWQQWILPFVISFCVGAALSIPQLRAARAPHPSWFQRHIFVISAFIAAAGLTCMRLGIAEDTAEWTTGIALVALELASAIIAEGIANAHRREWLFWKELYESFAVQRQKVGVATHEVELHEAAIEALEAEEDAFIQTLHDRESLHRAGPSLVNEARCVANDAYRSGIQLNYDQSLRGRSGRKRL